MDKKKILVTGATGFLGNVFIPLLLESPLAAEARVSVFALPGERMPAHFPGKVEVLRGDLRDRSSVDAAVAGSELVFHIAGAISYRNSDAHFLKTVNVDGASNLALSCAEQGVRRLVHVSSVGAIGFNPDGSLADEETAFNWPEDFHYMTTKRAGQEAVLKIGRERGLEVVVVNPASILGPGDPNPRTPMNSLYAMVMKHPLLPGTFSGGLALVDVRDVAALLLLAAERGRPGRKYLAVGANVSYHRAIEVMMQAAGKGFLPISAPTRMLALAGSLMEMIAERNGSHPLLTGSYGRLSGWSAFYSAERSRTELGMRYRSLEESMRDGLEYFKSTHHLAAQALREAARTARRGRLAAFGMKFRCRSGAEKRK